MSFACKILADSINLNGDRLTTFEVTFPRFILAEVNTHRALSRSSASSRAVPTWRFLTRLMNEPVIPKFGFNQKGMQASVTLENEALEEAQEWWLDCRNDALFRAYEGADRTGTTKAEKKAWTLVEDFLAEKGYFHNGFHKAPRHIKLHKQNVNRVIEPYMWHTAIVSATDWMNFFALRFHPDAQPEFQVIAEMMARLYFTSVPKVLTPGQWHLPLIFDEDIAMVMHEHSANMWWTLVQISVARCARVSYLTHDGIRDINEDIAMYERLVQSTPHHYSPTEHVARAQAIPIGGESRRSGNFMGFDQVRKMLPNENITEYALPA